MIETKELVKNYGARCVVNQVNLTMNKGEIVGLLGPNGAGKTTIFYIITGLIRPNKGKVFFNGEDITAFPMHRRSQRGLGYLPQETSIFKKLTVEKNIIILWEILNTIPKEKYEQRLVELLTEMGILHLRHAKGVELSGGEKRRVEIARCLATEPSFILLDEPFAGVDPIAIDDIQKIIKRLKQKGLGIVISDHNVRKTLEITDKAYLIHQGKLIISGESDTIINDPDAKKFYLGENFTL
jgi:lipopolysaccharide export system ATP-binding protein